MRVKSTDIALMVVIVAVWGVTALRSHGYYHADEHYQIIEFAGWKLGTHDGDELAWEFHKQIRPALQPTICYFIISIAEYLDVKDPYTQATLLRLLTAGLAMMVLFFFATHAIDYFGIGHKKAFFVACFLLWFIPFINVRFSSETWSGLTFMLCIGFILRYLKGGKSMQLPIAGLMAGLSFLFRYQAAILILSLVLWLLIVRRERVSAIKRFGVPVFLVILSGIAIDHWFYGEFTLTAWNYFRVNIIEDAAAGFGVAPWYDYIIYILKYPGLPIGIVILLSFFLLLIRQPKNLLLWITLPFIAVHSALAHKEARFLFPVVNYIPALVFIAWDELKGLGEERLKAFERLSVKMLLVLILLVNFTGLAAMMSKSAGIGRMTITRYIQKNYPTGEKILLYTPWSNPFNPWHSLPVKFYQIENLETRKIISVCEPDSMNLISEKIILLAVRKDDLAGRNCLDQLEGKGFELRKRSIPEWMEKLNRFYGIMNRGDILFLYELEK